MVNHSSLCLCLLFIAVLVIYSRLASAACRKGFRYECDDGKCIMNYMRCDTVSNCANGEDEKNCESSTCNSPLYPYRCSSGKCIPQNWVCDRAFRQDCPDGTDQMNCPFDCSGEDYWQCGDSVCIRKTSHCDGVVDCPDGSDESSCSAAECKKNEFRCNSGRCIRKKKVCDKEPDCPDQEDEEGCDENRECDEFSFRCDNGVCIFGYQVCDGYPNCRRGEDEDQDCGLLKCYKCEDWTGARRRCKRGNVEVCGENEMCATEYRLEGNKGRKKNKKKRKGKVEYIAGCRSKDYCKNAYDGARLCNLAENETCLFCCNEENDCNAHIKRPPVRIGRKRV
ncbi:low-density lipoprotein receptor-related protein 8-like [Ptychodera flava]|uniref:low-density lipoprotein receptor-related protein 8-like n=1 Tax=Ptychodera flava TaxID=63121 RepID=UPI003969CF61